MAVKNLDEYIAKMRTVSESISAGSLNKSSVSLTTTHLNLLMDLLHSLKSAVKKCIDEHHQSGHQQHILETIDKIIYEMDRENELH